MTWMELFLLLESMKKAKHTSLCDTPAQFVTVIMNESEYKLDLHESMTTGKLVFIPIMYDEEEDGDGEEDHD